MSTTRLVNISDVLAQLGEEFPDLTTSKIRFLEAKGLITPTRTEAGYRKYSGADVARLRTVLVLQRDQYLPLHAIAERLDAIDRGVIDPAVPNGSPAAPVLDPAQGFPALRKAKLRRAELVSAAEVPHRIVTDLESFGVIAADGQGLYSVEQVEVLKAAAALAEFGLEPRHLRAFLATADREVGLVEQVIRPIRSGQRRAEPDDQAVVLAALCLRLHTSLFRSGLAAAGL